MILDFLVDRLYVKPQVVKVKGRVTAVLAGEPLVDGPNVAHQPLHGRRFELALLARKPVRVDVRVQDVGPQGLLRRGHEVALVAEGEHVLDVAFAIFDVKPKVEGVVGHQRALGTLVTFAEKLGHLGHDLFYCVRC